MRIKWEKHGFRQLTQHPNVQADIVRRAKAVAAAAGDGYEVREPTQHPKRARAAVITATQRARLDNARNLTLVKALGAGS
uniref:Type I neck protein n=1 Tax=Dulem virus 32 TaxID=3145750 RepID=A0AAU8B0M1_9CAUD